MNPRIKHEIVVFVVVAVCALAIIGLILSGVDTDNLCTPPHSIGLYRPIGVGAGNVFSRLIAFDEDVDPNTQLPTLDDIVYGLYNSSTEYVHSTARPSSLVWAWLQFLEHDLVLTKRTNDTERDDFKLNTHGNREQINYASPYLDVSQIYGNTFDEAMATRDIDGSGRLKTDTSPYVASVEMMMPQFANDSFANIDARHDQSLLVDALYVLFVREHNYWCNRVLFEHPHLIGYDYYNIARHIVIAEVQAITYRTILPLLAGDGIRVNVPCFSSTDPLDTHLTTSQLVRRPSVYNEFAMGVLPFYLSMEVANDTAAAENTTNDEYIWEHGIGDILANASWEHARRRDARFDELLLTLARDRVYSERDHSIPPYRSYYRHYLREANVRCREYTYDETLCSKVAAVFDDEPVDLLTGVLLEHKQTSTTVLGSIAAHLFVEQFAHIKRGDPYFYLWDVVVEQYLSELHHVSLAKIIMRNTDVDTSSLRPDVFSI